LSTTDLEKEIKEADPGKNMYKIYHEIALVKLFPSIDSL
jgi:hypothetical protein